MKGVVHDFGKTFTCRLYIDLSGNYKLSPNPGLNVVEISIGRGLSSLVLIGNLSCTFGIDWTR